MKHRIKLESFEATAPESDAFEIDQAAFEEARLAAFEKGYTAGWDDAIAAQDAEMTRLRSDLGQNLQSLSFSYHEARQSVLEALRPLLHDMAAKVLPAIARDTLGQLVAEQLMPIAEGLTERPVTVVASPVSLPQIRDLLSGERALPLAFQAEPSLGECQVYLQFAETETQIDLDRVIVAIREAIETYFTMETEDAAHG